MQKFQLRIVNKFKNLVNKVAKGNVSKQPSKPIWKLLMIRPLRAITFRFSDRCTCSQKLYKDMEKQHLHSDGSVTNKIRLCIECVELNIEANEAIGRFYEKKEFKGKGNNGKTY